MKIYRGNKIAGKRRVTVDGNDLMVRHHSEHDLFAGFSWADRSGDSNEHSRGSKNLAYSLLADALGEDPAHLICDDFLQSVIDRLNPDRWELTDDDILEYSQHVCAIGFVAQQPWDEVGSGPSNISTIPAFPKIGIDPNYRLRDAAVRVKGS